MRPSDAFARAAVAAADGRLLDGKLLLAAGITALAQEIRIKPVVTGGTCVDFYAAEAVDSGPSVFPAWRASLDVDVVTLTPDATGAAVALRELLFRNGFRPAGKDDAESIRAERGWKRPGLPIPVEIIGQPFDGDPTRLVTLAVEDGTVFLRSPEDTLYEHVEWGAHAKDQRSWTRALAVARAQAGRLDLEYLRRRARDRGFSGALEKCLRGDALTLP